MYVSKIRLHNEDCRYLLLQCTALIPIPRVEPLCELGVGGGGALQGEAGGGGGQQEGGAGHHSQAVQCSAVYCGSHNGIVLMIC